MDKLDLARQIIEQTGMSLFLTGKAGTGKTTFLRNLRESSRKRMIVTAPTGIAAINAGGVTLHSFFQLDFGVFVPGVHREGRKAHAFNSEKIKIIRGLDLLVIDEVSMVRADLLDAVDAVLRRYRDRSRPFGGVQLLLIGDLQQLPPVVKDDERQLLYSNYESEYFFASRALRDTPYLTLELDHVYRQTDLDFLEILNSIRDHRVTPSLLERLNRRFIPGFEPDDNEGYIRLTTHNRQADRINEDKMERLNTAPVTFEAEIEGNFPENLYPIGRHLILKEGAQVMFIKNDTGYDRKYYNGMIGHISAITDEGVWVVPADGGDEIKVQAAEWENTRYEVDSEQNQIKEKRDGVFRQIPLKPAWAITIHKSQGLTFDRAVIDASLSFTHGQTYVALSRCRTLDGLVLDTRLSAPAIICDPKITAFMQGEHSQSIDDGGITTLTHSYWLQILAEMFNFRSIFDTLEGVIRIEQENFMSTFPQKINTFVDQARAMEKDFIGVGDRFMVQLRRLDAESGNTGTDPKVLQRIKDASVYFHGRLESLIKEVGTLPTEHDNKKVLKKLADRMEMFQAMSSVRLALLGKFSTEDFSVSLYLDTKAEAALENMNLSKIGRTNQKAARSEFSEENVHPGLFDSLNDWRRQKMQELKIPAFVIAHTKTLLAIANYMPEDFYQLGLLPGVGRGFVKNYGDDVLDLVEAYRRSVPEGELVVLPFPQPSKRRKH